jgi:hypothetical protein
MGMSGQGAARRRRVIAGVVVLAMLLAVGAVLFSMAL